jgi:hypothetical protein
VFTCLICLLEHIINKPVLQGAVLRIGEPFFFKANKKYNFQYLVVDTNFVCCYNLFAFGRLTQLGECNPYKVEVAGSSPASPTKRSDTRGCSSVG